MAPLISVFFFFFRKDLCWGLGDFVPQVVDIQIGGSTVPQKNTEKPVAMIGSPSSGRQKHTQKQKTCVLHWLVVFIKRHLIPCYMRIISH